MLDSEREIGTHLRFVVRLGITRRSVSSVLVRTDVLFTCLPASLLESVGISRWQSRQFQRADGSTFERCSGPALVRVGELVTFDDVIFGEPTDAVLLGSHSLSGLNLLVDPASGRLIDAGPKPVAATAA